MGELYGEFDAITHEWTDGLVPTLVRECVSDTTPSMSSVLTVAQSSSSDSFDRGGVGRMVRSAGP